MTLTEWIAEVRTLFPGDNEAVVRIFGAALHAESTGYHSLATVHLVGAVAREDDAVGRSRIALPIFSCNRQSAGYAKE